MTAKEIERISKALGDPHRLKIMQQVSKLGVLPCSEICEMINLAQPSVSHHLKQLTDSGLLLPEKEGRNVRYTINRKLLADYTGYLTSLGV